MRSPYYPCVNCQVSQCSNLPLFRYVIGRGRRCYSQGGFRFANFLIDVLTLFALMFWLWLVIFVFADLFRRGDISGWRKTMWVLGVILLPYIGALAYMISQGESTAERSVERVQQAREEPRNVVGFSVADEIEKLDRLKRSGSITDDEFTRLRAKLLKAA